MGHPEGKADTKKILTIDKFGTHHDSHVKYVIPINEIAKNGSGEAHIRKRNRDMINLRGIDLRMLVVNAKYTNDNLTPLPQQAQSFRVALVRPKRGQTLVAFQGWNTVTDFKFFEGAGVNKQVNFDPLGPGLDLHYLSINRQRYDVLWEKKFLLAPATTNDNLEQLQKYGSNWKMFKKYIPVNRQIHYLADDKPDDPIWLIWWATVIDKSEAADLSRDTESIYVEAQTILHYKEPKSA